MSNSKTLGFFLLAPALIFVVLFFLAPVLLTGVFALTNMSTATGIKGGAYQITETSLQRLRDRNLGQLADTLSQTVYRVDEKGLETLSPLGVPEATIAEIRETLGNRSFDSRRRFERTLKDLDNRPSTTREVKKISAAFKRSLENRRFESAEQLLAAVAELGLNLSQPEKEALKSTTYTGWVWTTENLIRMVSIPDTARILFNTILYVFATLIMFNTCFALVLAIATHYMAEVPAGIFRAIWLLPRISPPVLYVLLWKWLAWDTGFISNLVGEFGVASRNWMLDTEVNAWFFIILINGFVGASMGMLIFSSAIKAIPQQLFYASEVDGASRWVQIRHIILPQLRWPILFITCYQTLSLLTSFEYIYLATNGGPGAATEVWALAAFHSALNNYAGNLQYGYGAALALVLVVVGVVLSLAYLKLFDFRTLVAPPRIEQ